MRSPFAEPTARRGTVTEAGRPPGARRRPTVRSALKALAVAVTAMAASFAVAPSPAHAADSSDVQIMNVRSGLLADVMWASTSEFQGVFLWPNNTSASQEFDLLDSGGGFFRIRARHSGQCLMLDWRAGFYANGTPIIQYPACSAGYAPAEWSIRWVDVPPLTPCMCFLERHELLVNRATGRCLDANAPSGQPAQQAVLQQWDCITTGRDWNAANQMWSVDSVNPPIIH